MRTWESCGYQTQYFSRPFQIDLSMVATLAPVATKPPEYRSLKPLSSAGQYSISGKEQVSAFFLGPERMVIQQKDDYQCIAKGVVPIPIPGELEFALCAAMKSSETRMNVYKTWSGQVITDRNGGLYDSLTGQVFSWANKPEARREIYEALRRKGSCESPYHGIVQAMERVAGLRVRGLLLELADRQSEASFTLGGTVLVAKQEHAGRWRLTDRDFRAINAVRQSTQAKLLKCHMDELIGLAFATDLPIIMPTALYESSTMDALLELQIVNEQRTRLLLTAPYFSTPQELRLWQLEQEVLERQALSLRQRAAKLVPKAEEIKDASTFLRLKTSEKRAILRATGVRELPRPREGPRAVDAMIIPLLDEEVAYEVLRRLAETRGDFQLAAEMNDFESRKPFIARQINEARRKGDTLKARALCDELNSLSMLRFDPTNPDDPAKEWDVSLILDNMCSVVQHLN